MDPSEHFLYKCLRNFCSGFFWGILWNISANFLGRLSIVIFPSKCYIPTDRPTQSPPSGTCRARPDSPAQRANLPNKHLNQTVKSKQSRCVQQAVILLFSKKWLFTCKNLETSKIWCPDSQHFISTSDLFLSCHLKMFKPCSQNLVIPPPDSTLNTWQSERQVKHLYPLTLKVCFLT